MNKPDIHRVAAAADDPTDELYAGQFEAIDWGCSGGSSINYIRRHFGYTRIVGIDLSAAKVEMARQHGNSVIEADAAELRFGQPVVSASFLFHFLEHLPDISDAKQALFNAVTAAREFVLVRQPYFSGDDELLRCGLKFAWSTWHGHPNKMTALDFQTILSALRSDGLISAFRIGFAIRVADSSCDQILPVTADAEARFYDPTLHGPKPSISFAAHYREVCAAIAIAPDVDWKLLELAGRVNEWIYRSDNA